jgi:hypothetical protein
MVWTVEDGETDPPKCASGGDDGLKMLRAALLKAQVAGVDYEGSGHADVPVPKVRFVLPREGISVGGSLTALVYHAVPQPCGRSEEGRSEGFRVVTQSLTAVPCRWFLVVTKS